MADPMVSVEFRDGERLVPYHVALLMKGLETHTMTHDEAVRAANRELVKERLSRAQRDLVATHFRTTR